MTNIADFELLKLGPRPVNLADTFDFQQVQMQGVSLAVDAESRQRIAAANSAGKVGVAAKAVIPALIDMLGQDRVTAATSDLLERYKAGAATKADGYRAENMARLAESDLACHVAAADALVALGTLAIPAAVAALNSPTTNVRVGAAKVLGRIGPPAAQALDRLNELAKKDAAETVRKAAAEAVKQVKPKKKWFSF
jgi:HEAT repeat protein